MIRRPPRSTPFPTRRSSDLGRRRGGAARGPGQGAVRRAARRRLPPRTGGDVAARRKAGLPDRKSTRLNSSHANISYVVFCLNKKQTSSPIFHIEPFSILL